MLPFVPGAGQGPSSREHWTVGVTGLLVFPVSLVMPSALTGVCLSVLTPAERMKTKEWHFSAACESLDFCHFTKNCHREFQ